MATKHTEENMTGESTQQITQVDLGDLTDDIDDYAVRHGISQTSAIRQLVAAGLSNSDDTLREGLDRETYAGLLRDVELYARAVAAFAVAPGHPNGYEFGEVILRPWQRIRDTLYHVAAFPDANEVPDPFVDEARGIRELARADAERIAAHPHADWAN